MILNPTAVMNAIAEGATWAKSRLVVSSTPEWPKVNGSTWDLSTSSAGACLMRELVYKMLKSGTMREDGTVDVPPSSFTSGGNFMLTPVNGYAELRDPVP